MILKGFSFVEFCAGVKASSLRSTPQHKTGMFAGPEVSYHQTHSARNWLSILRTPYTTQNLQRNINFFGIIIQW
jgi:hypothetical protein